MKNKPLNIADPAVLRELKQKKRPSVDVLIKRVRDRLLGASKPPTESDIDKYLTNFIN